MQIMEEQIHRLQNEIQEMRRISPVGEILDRQSGGRTEARMDSSGLIAQEGSLRTAPLDMITHLGDILKHRFSGTPPTVMADRRVMISKYCSIVPTSTEITKKFSAGKRLNRWERARASRHQGTQEDTVKDKLRY